MALRHSCTVKSCGRRRGRKEDEQIEREQDEASDRSGRDVERTIPRSVPYDDLDIREERPL